MKPGLRLHIRLTEVSSPEELIQQVQIIEEVEAQLPREPQGEARAQAKSGRVGHALQAALVREECCWRCGQRGHDRFRCRNPPKRLCSWCGKEDVLTRDCPRPRPGNASWTGPTTLTARSKEATLTTREPSSRSE